MTRWALIAVVVALASGRAGADDAPTPAPGTPPGMADPALVLRDANTAATSGDWARVADEVGRLVDPRSGLKLGPADLAEAHRLAGLAAFFGNRAAEADQHFFAYLRIDLDGHLDPSLYPPEVVNFFNDVRARHAVELRSLRPKPKRNVFVLSLLPPLGQFQNGDRTKGWVIGGLLGAFAVSNVTSYFVIRSWCHNTGATCDNGGTDHTHGAQVLKVVNAVSGIGLIATYVYGVYDGVTRYRRREREVVTPYVTTTSSSAVIGIGGAF